MEDTNEQKETQEKEAEEQVMQVNNTPADDNEAWERFVRKTVVFYLR